MAATFKAYGIRVYCLDRQATAPFTAYFAYKFKCIMGVLITGRDQPKGFNGVMLFGNRGQVINQDVSNAIEKTMTNF
jgi:phosphomannomutase